jgi:hypothetical protein
MGKQRVIRVIGQPITFKNLKLDDVVSVDWMDGNWKVVSINHLGRYVKLSQRRHIEHVYESDLSVGWASTAPESSPMILQRKLFD